MTQVSDETGRKLLYAGLEAGGTKCVCAIGTAPDDLRALTQFPTTTPA
jgi:fructokinase